MGRTQHECKIIYHARKSPWTNRRVEGELEGQNSDGWMDGVMSDAERLGIRNWGIKARDRDGWSHILELAKTT
jgi:hypothetical protein